MSRATTRTNIKILALPPNAVAEEEEARKKEEKDKKKKAKVKGKQNDPVKKTKKRTTGEWHVYKEYCI
jgi:ATP-dependent DNA helicase PIF1